MSDTPRQPYRLIVPPPRGRRRRCVSAFIALFLLLQAAIPATYYVSAHASDERFCWRMFSTVRVHRVIHAKHCDVNVRRNIDKDGRLVDEPVAIESMIPQVWIASLKRNQVEVIRKVLDRCCNSGPARDVQLDVVCPKMEQFSFVPFQWVMDCDTRLMVRADGVP